jgi:ketosteroid isomerase-like protein
MHITEPEVARAFATAWIAAWNAHDLDRVLEHYTEDVEFASPYVARIAGEASGKLTGKSALRAYWAKALVMVPELQFTLTEILTGVATVTLVYRGHRGTVAETFQFDDTGRVYAATACYGIVE